MDRKLVEKRVQTLHEAIRVLRALVPEMSAHRLRLESGERMLRRIATDYEDQCKRLAELETSERKPPQRVSMRSRKKPIRRDTFESVGDYDMEQAKEMEDRFGHDIPDGSD